jgi:hypothetical protein
MQLRQRIGAYCSLIVLILFTIDSNRARAEQNAGTGMADLVRRFAADVNVLERRYDVKVGSQRIDRLQRFYADVLAELDTLNFDALDQAGRIDYLLLRSHARFQHSSNSAARNFWKRSTYYRLPNRFSSYTRPGESYTPPRPHSRPRR